MAIKISLKQLYIKLFPFLLIAALAFEMNPRAGLSRKGAFWILSCNYSLGAGLGPEGFEGVAFSDFNTKWIASNFSSPIECQ